MMAADLEYELSFAQYLGILEAPPHYEEIQARSPRLRIPLKTESLVLMAFA